MVVAIMSIFERNEVPMKSGFRKTIALNTVFVLLSLLSVTVEAADGQRAPPVARTAGTLGQAVMRAIQSIQVIMSPETGEPDFELAKEKLDKLYERRYERMNAFEKATILNFYTTYYLSTDNIPAAITIFEQLLALEELSESTRQRALLALGQLYLSEENFESSMEI